jgi:hypothetical protein
MLFELEQVQGVCSKCTSLDTEDSWQWTLNTFLTGM